MNLLEKAKNWYESLHDTEKSSDDRLSVVVDLYLHTHSRDNKLSKADAKEAMRFGYTVSHTTFSDDEHIKMSGCMIITEEGYTIDEAEFWRYRTHANFETGWKIIQ